MAYFKKILLIILFLSLSGCNNQSFLGVKKETFETKKLKYSDILKVKAEKKEDVLHAETTDVCIGKNEIGLCNSTIKAVSYVYKSKVKVEKQKRYLENGKFVKEKKAIKNELKKEVLGAVSDVIEEDISLRTYNTLFFPHPDGTATTAEIFTGASFYYEDPDWVFVEYATSSLEAYNDQMDADFATSTELGWIEWNNIFSKKTIKYLLETKIAKADTLSPYTGSGDGGVSHYNAAGGSNWAVSHDATTGTAASYTSTTWITDNNWHCNPGMIWNNVYYIIGRAFLPIYTAALPDDASISAATLNVYAQYKADEFNSTYSFVTVVSATQASSTTLSTADYNDLTTTEAIDSGERADYTGVSTAAYTSFDFNATGIAMISLTEYTKIGLRDGYDLVNIAPSTSATTKNQWLRLFSSEYTGTSNDPYITITYTSGGGVTTPANGFQITEF